MSRHRCIICHKELTQDETITIDNGMVHNYCKEHVGQPITKQIKKEVKDELEW